MRIFYNSKDITNNEINLFKRKSKWTTLINREPALETYIKLIGGKIQHFLAEALPTAPMITLHMNKEKLCHPYGKGRTSSLSQPIWARP